MNFGTDAIEQVIWNQIRMCGGKFNSGIPGGNKKFVRDLSKKIMELIGEEMHPDMQAQFLARGGSPAVIAVYDRLCKALGFSIMDLKPKDIAVYEWIIERENEGQKIETFAKWAKSAERAQYIRMYRKDTDNIKIDWPRAFDTKQDFIISADNIR